MRGALADDRVIVCVVLYNRVGEESIMDVGCIYSPAKDYPEWDAMALGEIISHYRGVPLQNDSPVKITGPQGGGRNTWARRRRTCARASTASRPSRWTRVANA